LHVNNLALVLYRVQYQKHELSFIILKLFEDNHSPLQ